MLIIIYYVVSTWYRYVQVFNYFSSVMVAAAMWLTHFGNLPYSYQYLKITK